MKSIYRSLVTNVILALLVILPIGCSKDPPSSRFVGPWEGTITETSQSFQLLLVLRIDEDKNELKGSFSITEKDGEPWDQTPPREIRSVETTGFKLKFVVPNMRTGEIDDDSLIMDLKLGDNHLVGSCRRKKSGSQSTSITLTKRPSPQADPNRFLRSTS